MIAKAHKARGVSKVFSNSNYRKPITCERDTSQAMAP
jgi:hypothetical protein